MLTVEIYDLLSSLSSSLSMVEITFTTRKTGLSTAWSMYYFPWQTGAYGHASPHLHTPCFVYITKNPCPLLS